MDWPSYLRKVVSRTAGAAAGVAVAAGGPIAVASAGAAAEQLSDDLLAQFMGAHADQMQRIEELGQEMRGRLIGVQDAVGGLLDAPWRTALAHIEEASSRPSRREQELELARVRLFDAWGVAEGLLGRNAMSQDPAALRCPLIAQQIAALYSFLGEPLNTARWLAIAYAASRNQLNNRIDAAHDMFVQKVIHAKRKSTDSSRLQIQVWSVDRNSQEPLWVRAPGFVYETKAGEPWRKMGTVERDLGFEGCVAALVELDAEAQLLRKTCLWSGADEAAMPSESSREGARRAVTSMDNGYYAGALVVFDSTTAVGLDFSGHPSEVQSPLEKPAADRYGYIWRRGRLLSGTYLHSHFPYFASAPNRHDWSR